MGKRIPRTEFNVRNKLYTKEEINPKKKIKKARVPRTEKNLKMKKRSFPRTEKNLKMKKRSFPRTEKIRKEYRN